MKKNYWISWYHKEDFSDFELHFPWWITGWNDSGNATICAAIKADDKLHAKVIIANSYDKSLLIDSIDWRFCEERSNDWSPYSGRFPPADWMLKIWNK